jgi:hypothetical protein
MNSSSESPAYLFIHVEEGGEERIIYVVEDGGERMEKSRRHPWSLRLINL